MTRADAATAAARVAAAVDALAAGTPHSVVVSGIVAEHGVSRRQAQRIVAAAVRELRRDLTGGDDREALGLASAGVLHQTLAGLQRAATVALEGERPQPAAAVGAYRAVLALVEMAHKHDIFTEDCVEYGRALAAREAARASMPWDGEEGAMGD